MSGPVFQAVIAGVFLAALAAAVAAAVCASRKAAALRGILDAYCIALLDGKGRIVQASRTLADLAGAASPKLLCGRLFTDAIAAFLAPGTAATVNAHLANVFAAAYDRDTLRSLNPLHELRCLTPAGLRKTFRCDFLAVQPAAGRTLALATLADVTAKAELRERLAATVRALAAVYGRA